MSGLEPQSAFFPIRLHSNSNLNRQTLPGEVGRRSLDQVGAHGVPHGDVGGKADDGEVVLTPHLPEDGYHGGDGLVHLPMKK